ncbi:ribonuclease H-like domain-containing protein, partial [Tanacetum coccineum]
EQLSTLISLINENSVCANSMHVNMAETMGVITDSRANQHITFTDKFLDLKAGKVLGTGRQFGGLYYFDGNQGFLLDGSIDHSELPYDDERSDPGPSRCGTPSSHSGSTSDTHNENEGWHSLGSNAAASENDNCNNISKGNGPSILSRNDQNIYETHNLRRSSRTSVFPRNYNDFVVESKVKYGLEKYVNYTHLLKDNYCFTSVLNKSFKPKSFEEAAKHQPWIDAINSKMDALYRNNTWDLVELPKGRTTIVSKWVCKIKYKSDGEIERYKARLVAKGFNQREGIDFDETFSLVVKIVTVRCLINLAVQNGWTLYQMDVNNAFLYGDLNETVYVSLPPGYFPKVETRVCKLNKSLYGLKQAPRQWNAKLTFALIECGFVQSKSDYSLFTKKFGDVFIALLVYVDDIIITDINLNEINKFKQFLKTKFMIKDLRKLKYFLGIKVLGTPTGVCLSQRKYYLELIDEFGLLASKPSYIPMQPNISLSSEPKDDDPLLDNITDYQKLIGKLIYLTTTRPDIAYTVSCLSQFMHNPLKSHLKIALKVIRYLKGYPSKGVNVIRTSTSVNVLKAYTDADWTRCTDTRRSVTGYCVFMNNSLVSSKSKKQNTMSKSSTEAEYRALASVTSEVVWV